MCWSSSSTKRGTTSVPQRKPEATMSASRPSMIALVSTTIAARRALAVERRRPDPARRRRPTASRRLDQVVALGDGQAQHPEAQERARRRAAAATRTASGRLASGRPSSRPMSRPRSRPATAVDELAGGQVLDARDQPARRDDREVGQDREADARPRRRPRPRAGRRRTSASRGTGPRAAAARTSPTSPPSAAPRSRIKRITSSSADSRRPPDRARLGRAVSLASPGRHRHDARVRRGRLERLAQRARPR